MTARALKELLDCMPEDVLALDIYLDTSPTPNHLRMVLVDPPNNWDDAPPRITLTIGHGDEDNPEIICRVLPRHS